MLSNAKYIAVLIVTLLTINVSRAQLKHDANWVFGHRCGISFLNPNSPEVFLSSCDGNFEQNGSISNENGSLLFYFSDYKGLGSFLGEHAFLLDHNNQPLLYGDTIKANYTMTSGALILKNLYNEKYSIFHLFPIIGDSRCNNQSCAQIYMSVVSLESCGEICVEKKNILLSEEPLYERMVATKHANGKDWWIILHTEIQSNGIFENTFMKFLISDTIVSGPFYQKIGLAQNKNKDSVGQIKISIGGNNLALARSGSNIFELYDFDRCNGELSNYRNIKINSLNNFELYGLEFSQNRQLVFLTATKSTIQGWESKLYQVGFDSAGIINPTQIYNSVGALGQLQIAPDNKIYIAGHNELSSNSTGYNFYNQNLSVINQPDSIGLACDFQPYSFYLGDSSRSSWGLPNFPNYNLEALSIYEADAGQDTVLCIDSTVNQKVVVLGTPPINGVQYQWYPNYNLSSDTVAQPLAYPDSSTMYYLMLSDTTITNACKTRLDSVYVEVKKCISSVHGQLSTDHSVKVFPNPASNEIKIESEGYKIEHVTIYDVAGKALLSPFEGGVCSHCVQAGDEIIINIKELSQGIYFIQTQLANGQTTINKLVKQ